MMRRHSDSGFALLGVLWIIVGIGVLALGMGRVSQHAVLMAEMAQDRIKGRWLAEGCLARLRSVTNHALAQDPMRAASVWRTLDHLVLVDSGAAIAGCEISLHTEGRVVLDRATAAELDTLPGMTPEAVAHILQTQQSGAPIADLLVIEGALSPPAKVMFDTHYADLLRTTTVEPDAWVIRSRAHVGTPPTPVNIEVRLARAGSRAAIIRWVEW